VTDSLEIEYEPPGPVSAAFLASDAFVRGIRGPYGSGKSSLCCFEILRRAQQQEPYNGKRRTRWAVVRETYPELKTTTIKTWHEIMPRQFGHWTDQGPPTHVIETDELWIEVLFLALESIADVKKVLSMDLTGAWVNEAREIPKAVIDGITSRCGRFPPIREGGPTWYGTLMDTNSPDTEHWWYTLAERDSSTVEGQQILESTDQAEAELRRMGLLKPGQPMFEFFAQPSALSPQAENVSNLPLGYYQRMMAGKTEDWTRVYVHGEYGFLQEGKAIYPEYADHAHCAKAPLVPRQGGATIGMDFGLTPAATFHQRQPTGTIWTFDELVSTRMGATEFAKELVTVIAKYPQCSFDIVGDPSGEGGGNDDRTVFQILAANGIIARPARTNEPGLRQGAVRGVLSRLLNGKPAWQVSPTCTRLRKAMAGGYCLRRIQVSGSERFREAPDKNMHSHVAESAEYAFLEMGENPRAILPGLEGAGRPATREPWAGVMR
jgi:hypothetical protein